MNSTPGWWRSRVNFPLAIVVVQLFAVYKLFAARLAHTRREEDHREIIGACGQATQKSTICLARGDLYRDDNRLSETPEPSIVSRVPLTLPMDEFNDAQTDGRSMPRRNLVTLSSRRRPQLRRRWILSRVHHNSAGSPRRWTRCSRHGLKRGQTNNFNVSLFPSTPNPSISGCSGWWPTQHLSVLRPWCLYRSSSVMRSRIGIHADLLIEIDIRSVLFSKFELRAEASRWLLSMGFVQFLHLARLSQYRAGKRVQSSLYSTLSLRRIAEPRERTVISPLAIIHINWWRHPFVQAAATKLFLSDTFVAAQTFRSRTLCYTLCTALVGRKSQSNHRPVLSNRAEKHYRPKVCGSPPLTHWPV